MASVAARPPKPSTRAKGDDGTLRLRLPAVDGSAAAPNGGSGGRSGAAARAAAAEGASRGGGWGAMTCEKDALRCGCA